MTTSEDLRRLVFEEGAWRVREDMRLRLRIADLIAEGRRLEEAGRLEAAIAAYDDALFLKRGLAARERRIKARLARTLDNAPPGVAAVDAPPVHLNAATVEGLEARHFARADGALVPGVRFTLRNEGERPLGRVEVIVYFKDTEGEIIARERYTPVSTRDSSRPPLRPGVAWSPGEGTFLPAESVPEDWEGKAIAKVIAAEEAPFE